MADQNKDKKRVIGICGRPGSGKSTIANYLKSKHGFKEYTFAEKVKEIVSVVSDFNTEYLKQNHDDREKIKDKTFGLTGRKMMQMVGTIFRNNFSEDFWIKLLKKNIDNSSSNDNIVISDCRFDNEIRYVMSLPNSSLFVIYSGDFDFEVTLYEREHEHNSNYAFIDVIKKSEFHDKIHYIKNVKGDLEKTLLQVDKLIK